MAVKIAASRVVPSLPTESRVTIPVTNSKVQAPLVITAPATQAEVARVSPPQDSRKNLPVTCHIDARTESIPFDDGINMSAF